MVVFLIRRLLQSLLVVAIMSLLVFVGVFLIGDPLEVLISPNADQAEIDRVKHRLGLDQPPWVQYMRFVAQALKGDLGTSFVHGISSIGIILERLPATLELAVVAMVLAVLLGIPVGLW